jgi:hypothetical protein
LRDNFQCDSGRDIFGQDDEWGRGPSRMGKFEDRLQIGLHAPQCGLEDIAIALADMVTVVIAEDAEPIEGQEL